MIGPSFQPSTIAVLQQLQKRGALTIHQIGKMKALNGKSATVRVASMVKRGTVHRIGNDRPARYGITRKGREAIKAVANGQGNLTPRTLMAAVPTPPAPPTIHASPAPACRASGEIYQGTELRPFDARPGAMDAFAVPSRMGKVLVFRDGHMERVA